jgi:hypothetical protein
MTHTYKKELHTMAKFKDFGTGTTDIANAEPISFKLYGEEFICLPKIQGKVLLDFIQRANSEDASENSKIIQILFDKVLTAESYLRFDALLEDKTRIVTIETLSEIVGWLISEYSARPEEQPEVSPAGQ